LKNTKPFQDLQSPPGDGGQGLELLAVPAERVRLDLHGDDLPLNSRLMTVPAAAGAGRDSA
jgi:hypothetical protein